MERRLDKLDPQGIPQRLKRKYELLEDRQRVLPVVEGGEQGQA
jgi:hypothetical protein